jgi:23S rRNA G2069 N7-methylase RlmK/C1962 C5-methylase RlmI
MEYFYSEGGNNKPYFVYRFNVRKVTTEMFEWCQKYPEKGPFSRFHIIYNDPENFERDNIIQFELKDAYLAFMYAFAGEILEDVTMKEYR